MICNVFYSYSEASIPAFPGPAKFGTRTATLPVFFATKILSHLPAGHFCSLLNSLLNHKGKYLFFFLPGLV